jgi:hypothetical protein
MAKPDKPPPVEEVPPDQIAPEVPNVEEEIPPVLLVQPPHVPGTPVVRLCPNAITCPGSDSPFQNFSSESPDGLDFLSIQFAYGDDWGAPPLQTQYELLSCGIVLSRSTTPFDAALQALANAISCAGPQKTVFNNPKVCKVPGPNGSFRYYTIPGGTIVAANQLTADQQAAALACHFAAQNPLQLTQTLANGCNNQAYAAQIRASGGTSPYIFALGTVGPLPAGVTFEQNDVASCLISGTPTQAGNFPFSIIISDANGLQFEQTYALVVMDIPNATVLPSVFQGSSYFAHLIPAGGFPPYTFVLDHFSPALPPGISMDTSGEFTGVPSTTQPINILVDMIDSAGNICLIDVKSLACGTMWAAFKPWQDQSGTATAGMGTAFASATFDPVANTLTDIAVMQSPGNPGDGANGVAKAQSADNPAPIGITCSLTLKITSLVVSAPGSWSGTIILLINDVTTATLLISDSIDIRTVAVGFTKTYELTVPKGDVIDFFYQVSVISIIGVVGFASATVVLTLNPT